MNGKEGRGAQTENPPLLPAVRGERSGPAEEADTARLGREAGELAAMASRLLAEELRGGGDTKRARELSGIFKDMAVLSRELGDGAEQTLTVRFEGGAERAAE